MMSNDIDIIRSIFFLRKLHFGHTKKEDHQRGIWPIFYQSKL